MKTETSNSISWHITGNYPTREIDPAEYFEEPMRVVHFQRGFETMQVAVYGHGLCEADCYEAAVEFLMKNHPVSLTEDDLSDYYGSDQS